MFADAAISATVDRLIYLAVLIYGEIAYYGSDIRWGKDHRVVIDDPSKLLQSLSDELHARAFDDFEGAGRLIKFVYLVGNNNSAVLNYVNDYSKTFDSPPMHAAEKFC